MSCQSSLRLDTSSLSFPILLWQFHSETGSNWQLPESNEMWAREHGGDPTSPALAPPKQTTPPRSSAAPSEIRACARRSADQPAMARTPSSSAPSPARGTVRVWGATTSRLPPWRLLPAQRSNLPFATSRHRRRCFDLCGIRPGGTTQAQAYVRGALPAATPTARFLDYATDPGYRKPAEPESVTGSEVT